jgi:hypothetical protein
MIVWLLQVDSDTGYRTQTILAVPIRAVDGKVLGVVQLINKAEMGDIHAGILHSTDHIQYHCYQL